MKKTKILMPLLSVASVGCVALPMASCSCGQQQEEGNVDVKLFSEVKGVQIDKQKATKGENFIATITSTTTPLIDIRSILSNDTEITIKDYDFKLSDDRLSGELTVRGEKIIGDELTITVITDREEEYHLSITDGVDNTNLYVFDEWMDKFDKDPSFVPTEDYTLSFASSYGVRCNMGGPGDYYTLYVDGEEFTGYYYVEEVDSREGGTYQLVIPKDSIKLIHGNMKLSITRFTYIYPRTVDEKAWVLNLQATEDLESLIADRGKDLLLEVDWDGSPLEYKGFIVYANGIALGEDDWTFTEATDEERTQWPGYEGYIKVHGDCVLDPISVKILY